MDQLAERRTDGLDEAIGALLAPQLEPLFARPSRLGVDSAWYGHVPFARWIVRAARPRTVVELGTHAGVSYAAFCDAVLAEGLDARCFAVDTWAGDDHAGFYDEAVFEFWRAFHDARYAGFSRLLRCAFDAALPYIPDASVDLLHIDGRHRYADVAHDFEAWRPKVSRRGVVLFHDTNVRERDFGVWRFWAEQSALRPGFEFLHAHGLGVLAVGEDAPEAVMALCRLRESRTAGVLRDRFALLGERWALTQQLAEMARGLSSAEQAPEAASRHRAAKDANRALMFQIAEARNELVVAADAAVRLEMSHADAVRSERADWRARLLHAEERGRLAATEARHATARALAAEREAARLREAHAALLDSLPWRLTRPLRSVLGLLGREPPSPPDPPPPPSLQVAAVEPAVEPEPTPAAAPPDPRPRILFLSGEPATPGHQYRVVRAMALAEAAGWRADWSEVAPVGPHTLAGARIVVMWRVPWSPHVQGILDASAGIGARVLFDGWTTSCSGRSWPASR